MINTQTTLANSNPRLLITQYLALRIVFSTYRGRLPTGHGGNFTPRAKPELRSSWTETERGELLPAAELPKQGRAGRKKM